MVSENLAGLFFTVAATFAVCAKADDLAAPVTTSHPSGIPVPTTVTQCAQSCISQAALQNGCADPSAEVTCICENPLFIPGALQCVQKGCPPEDSVTALQAFEQLCGVPASSVSASAISPLSGASSVFSSSVSPTLQSSKDGQHTLPGGSTPTGANESGGDFTTMSIFGGGTTSSDIASLSSTLAPGTGFTAYTSSSPPSSSPSTGSAIPTSTHSHNSSLGLLISLPLILATIFVVALAFIYRRARLRRHERSTRVQPHSLPPLSHPSAPHAGMLLKENRFRHPVSPGQTVAAPELDADPGQQHGSARTPSRLDGLVLAYADVSSASPVHRPSLRRGEVRLSHNTSENEDFQVQGREIGAEERMMVLPWSLGERLLAGLRGRHEGAENSSTVGSETLPPYEAQDART